MGMIKLPTHEEVERMNYQVSLEISGPTAMWTRPDTGDAPVTYPAPSFAAVKGIFESIVWLKSAEVVPTRVEVFSPNTTLPCVVMQ
jgi:CRISPR-associated protein Cas5d